MHERVQADAGRRVASLPGRGEAGRGPRSEPMSPSCSVMRDASSSACSRVSLPASTALSSCFLTAALTAALTSSSGLPSAFAISASVLPSRSRSNSCVLDEAERLGGGAVSSPGPPWPGPPAEVRIRRASRRARRRARCPPRSRRSLIASACSWVSRPALTSASSCASSACGERVAQLGRATSSRSAASCEHGLLALLGIVGAGGGDRDPGAGGDQRPGRGHGGDACASHAPQHRAPGKSQPGAT